MAVTEAPLIGNRFDADEGTEFDDHVAGDAVIAEVDTDEIAIVMLMGAPPVSIRPNAPPPFTGEVIVSEVDADEVAIVMLMGAPPVSIRPNIR